MSTSLALDLTLPISKDGRLHRPKLGDEALQSACISYAASVGEIATGRPNGEVPLVRVENSIERMLTNVQRGRMWQKVVTNEESQEDEVVDQTFNVKGTTRNSLLPEVSKMISGESLAFAGVWPNTNLGVDMTCIGLRR